MAMMAYKGISIHLKWSFWITRVRDGWRWDSSEGPCEGLKIKATNCLSGKNRATAEK
jgi:hypothetical protein